MHVSRSLLCLVVALTPCLLACGDAMVGEEGCFGKGVSCDSIKEVNDELGATSQARFDIVATRQVVGTPLGALLPGSSFVESDARGTLCANVDGGLMRTDGKGRQELFALGKQAARDDAWRLGNLSLSLDGSGLPVLASSFGAVFQLDEQGQAHEQRLTGDPAVDTAHVDWVVSDRKGGYFALTRDGLSGFDNLGALRFRQTRFVPDGFSIPGISWSGVTSLGKGLAAVASDGALGAIVIEDNGEAAWLTSLSVDGNGRWARQLWDVEASTTFALAIDHEDNFIVARAIDDLIDVDRFSAEGEHLETFRAERFEYQSVRSVSLAVDPEGTIFVATFSGSRDDPQTAVCRLARELSECVSVVDGDGDALTVSAMAAPAPGVVVVIRPNDSPLLRVEL